MKSLFNLTSKESNEKESEPSTSDDLPVDNDQPRVATLTLQNMRKNVGNAWNSILYGKWRRRGDILEDGNSQIWLLGRCYIPQGQGSTYDIDCPLFFQDYSSKIWLTYRNDFSPLNGAKQVTSDSGWGCMIRSSQMMIAQALTVLLLGRAYRLTEQKEEILRPIIKLFEDAPDSQLGIHKLMQLAGDAGVGEWYTPSRAMALIRDAVVKSDDAMLKDLRVYLSADNCVILNEIYELAENWSKAVVIVVCVRLGTKTINDCYKHHMKSILSIECCIGAVGGRPKHSVYFVGFHGDKVFHLDPHVAQKYNSLESEDTDTWKTFHCRKTTQMKLDEMDPSCALGFLVQNQRELNQLLKTLVDCGIIECGSDTGFARRQYSNFTSNALFSVMDDRISPTHLVDQFSSTEDMAQEDDLHGFEVV